MAQVLIRGLEAASSQRLKAPRGCEWPLAGSGVARRDRAGGELRREAGGNPRAGRPVAASSGRSQVQRQRRTDRGGPAALTPIVVDSSVAMKWFVPEALSDQALRLLDGDHRAPRPGPPHSRVWQRPLEEDLP